MIQNITFDNATLNYFAFHALQMQPFKCNQSMTYMYFVVIKKLALIQSKDASVASTKRSVYVVAVSLSQTL